MKKPTNEIQGRMPSKLEGYKFKKILNQANYFQSLLYFWVETKQSKKISKS